MGDVADDADIDMDHLVDRRRIDVDMDLLGFRGANLSIRPVIRSSNRAPILIMTSQSCIVMLASYVPCMPSMPSQFLPLAG
jgi:hypothetical protein